MNNFMGKIIPGFLAMQGTSREVRSVHRFDGIKWGVILYVGDMQDTLSIYMINIHK